MSLFSIDLNSYNYYNINKSAEGGISMNNTCFVIMPIGTQKIGEIELSEDKLREKYDFIIKNAILKAEPTLDVIRADEELNPGSISNDIFTKLMHSKYVIADITYPNPNVFYELGIRHAIRTGTILIREKVNFTIPFDISHLRYIEYSQEPSSMDKLAKELKKRFDFYTKNPGKPDNQFLELCSFTNYLPTIYAKPVQSKEDVMANLFGTILSNTKLIQAIFNDSLNSDEQAQIIFEELSKDPDNAKNLITDLLKNGLLD